MAHPIFGYGPDQYEAATVTHYSVAFARTTAQAFFSDAHNVFVEVAVVTGVLGLLAFLAFLFFALRDRGGPLVVFAVAILAGELAEPLFVGLTALAFLAIGAAPVRRATPRATRYQLPTATRHSPGSGPTKTPRRLSSLGPHHLAHPGRHRLRGGNLADRGRRGPATDGGSAHAGNGGGGRRRRHHGQLPPSGLAHIGDNTGLRHLLHAGPAGKARQPRPRDSPTEAVQRDPTSSKAWLSLATFQFAAGDNASARRSALRAMALNPVSFRTDEPACRHCGTPRRTDPPNTPT